MTLESEVQVDILAKGEQGQSGHLEVLLAPRNANYGDAEQQTASYVAQTCPEAAKNAPQQVERNAQTARRTAALGHCGTEGPQTQQSYLECLQSPWNTYDGACQCQTAAEVADSRFQTSKDEPYDVAKYFHIYMQNFSTGLRYNISRQHGQNSLNNISVKIMLREKIYIFAAV
jgi:hypothetical protein